MIDNPPETENNRCTLLYPYPNPFDEGHAVFLRKSIVRILQPAPPLRARRLHSIAKVIGFLRPKLGEPKSVFSNLIAQNKEYEDR
jgi:hypothetical protein